MMDDIYKLLYDGIDAILDFFDQMMSSVDGLWLFVLSFIFMFLSAKLFLTPLLGGISLGSDFAGTGLVRTKSSDPASRKDARKSSRSGYYRRKGKIDK